MDNPFAIRDIAPPVESLPSSPVWPWLLVVLAALGVVAVLIRVLRKAEPEAVPELTPPPLTALEIALRALDALLNEHLIEGGETKRFFARLNMILRVFLLDQFSLQAPVQTTSELIESCVEAALIEGEGRERLATFLRECDVFKFADVVARQNVARRAHRACGDLLTVLAVEREGA